jgi:hypothetical protein
MTEVQTRKEARESGQKLYYNAKPCPQGHVTFRQVSDGSCCKCKRKRRNEWGKTAHGKQWVKNSRPSTSGRLRPKRHENRIKAVEYKGSRCMDCGWTGHIAAFEFDHPNGLDPSIPKRKQRIGYILASYGWGSRAKSVLDNLDLVCANCHNIRSWNRGKWGSE